MQKAILSFSAFYALDSLHIFNVTNAALTSVFHVLVQSNLNSPRELRKSTEDLLLLTVTQFSKIIHQRNIKILEYKSLLVQLWQNFTYCNHISNYQQGAYSLGPKNPPAYLGGQSQGGGVQGMGGGTRDGHITVRDMN